MRLQGKQQWDATYDPIRNFFATPPSRGGLVYDFDSGEDFRNSLCNSGLGAPGDPLLCDLGFGLDEVSLGSGDSGSPGFIDGRIAGVGKFVFQGSNADGSPCSHDFDGAGPDPEVPTIACFGAIGGHVDVGFPENLAFIYSVTGVPAAVSGPPTAALLGLGLLTLAGIAARHRRREAGAPRHS